MTAAEIRPLVLNSPSPSGVVYQVASSDSLETLGISAVRLGASLQAPPKKRAPWVATLASLALPGAGQALLGQQRSVAYLAAESFLILRAVRAQRDANEAKNRYRALAADVARRDFGTDRPPGNWDYYEILEQRVASGAYDLTPGGQFTPEADTATYNGAQWYEARSQYWDDPDSPPPVTDLKYQRALNAYKARAVQGSFRWSWRDQLFTQGEYREAINEANLSKQRLVTTGSIIAANHLVSMVDAYVNVRLRRHGAAGIVNASIRTELRPVGLPSDNTYGAAVNLSIAFGRP